MIRSLIKTFDGRNIGGILTGTTDAPVVVMIRHWFSMYDTLPDLRGKVVVFGDGSEAIVTGQKDVSFGVVVLDVSRSPRPVPIGTFVGGTATMYPNNAHPHAVEVSVSRTAWSYVIGSPMASGLSGSPLFAGGKVIGLASTEKNFVRLDVVPALKQYVVPDAPVKIDAAALLRIKSKYGTAIYDGIPLSSIVDLAIKGLE